MKKLPFYILATLAVTGILYIYIGGSEGKIVRQKYVSKPDTISYNDNRTILARQKAYNELNSDGFSVKNVNYDHLHKRTDGTYWMRVSYDQYDQQNHNQYNGAFTQRFDYDVNLNVLEITPIH